MAFILEYGAYLQNRLRKGNDGMVPYERLKGKKPTILGAEFGEKVLYKIQRDRKWKKSNLGGDLGYLLG